MIRVHPKLSRATNSALVALVLGIAGCRSSSTGMAGSPFLAPDRVPPPSTRALLPGQAQPYYPGDPLPAMQSAKNQPANVVAANPAEPNARSSTGRTLAWNTPGASAPAPPAAMPSAPSAPTPTPTPIVASNEGSVAVPVDADPLRFALPPPREPEQPAPIAAAAPAPIPQPNQPPTSPLMQGVLLASYNAPVANRPPQVPLALPTPPPQQVTSPWRTPQIAPSTTAPTYAMQPPMVQPQNVAPIALPAPPIAQQMLPQLVPPTNPMGVTLRPVASPPPQPGDPMPRVRMPGYIDTPQISADDGFRPRTSMQ